MVVRLATLRATATLNAQNYAQGAAQVNSANAQMRQGQAGVAQSMNQTRARTTETAAAFDRYRQRIDPAYRAQQNFIIGAQRLDAALSKGQISLRQHAALMGTLRERYADAINVQERVTGSSRSLLGTVLSLRGAFAGVVGVLGIRELVRYADTATLIGSQLRLVVDASEDLATVQQKILDLANETRSSFEGTAQLYARVSRNAEQLNLAQSEVFRLAEVINKAIRISGTTSQEAAAGVIQLSQSFASGRLNGDEFRSVMENMPRVARAVADGLGITIGELRELANNQQLASAAVAQAILSQGEALDQEFSQITQTVGENLTVLENNFINLIDKINKSTEATESVNSSLMSLSDTLNDPNTVEAGVAVVTTLAAALDLVVKSAVGAYMAVRDLFKFIDEKTGIGSLSSTVLGADTSDYSLYGPDGLLKKQFRPGAPTQPDLNSVTRRILGPRQSGIELYVPPQGATTFGSVNLSGNQDPDFAAEAFAKVRKEAEAADNASARMARSLLGAGKSAKDTGDGLSKAEREALKLQKHSEQVKRDLEEYIKGLEDEAILSGMTAENRAKEEALLKAMAISSRFLTDIEKERIILALDTAEARKKELEVQEEQQKKFEETVTFVKEEAADALVGLFTRGKEGVDDFIDYWKERFIRLLAELAAEALVNPIIVPLIQSAGGLFGGGGGAGGLGANFGSQGPGGLSNLTGSLSGLSKSVDSLGRSLGIQGFKPSAGTPEMLRLDAQGLFGTETFLSDVLGGALGGLGIGSTTAALTGGNSVGGAVGGLVGGALGSFLGPIGSLVGGAVGGFLGGLFGPKPTNATAIIDFDQNYNRTQVPFSKETAETRAAINNAADQITGVVRALETTGTTFNDRITRIGIGTRDPSYIQFEKAGLRRSAVGDPNALALEAIKGLLETATFTSESVRKIANTSFSSLEELTTALDFAINTYDKIAQAKPALTATEQAMEDLTEGLKRARKEAERYGLSVDALNAGARKLFDFDIATQIQQIVDPVGAALSEFERGAAARLKVAQELGADLVQVEKLNALEREAVLKQAGQQSINGLKALIDDIEFGNLSLGVAPEQQYFSALTAYNQAREAALSNRSPEAIAAFEEQARSFLPIAQSFLGVSTRFADVRSGILQTARELGTPSLDPSTAAIITATLNGSSQVVEAVKQNTDVNKEMNDQFKEIAAFLRALMGKFANAA